MIPSRLMTLFGLSIVAGRGRSHHFLDQCCLLFCFFIIILSFAPARLLTATSWKFTCYLHFLKGINVMILNKIWKKKTNHDHYRLYKCLLLLPTVISWFFFFFLASSCNLHGHYCRLFHNIPASFFWTVRLFHIFFSCRPMLWRVVFSICAFYSSSDFGEITSYLV